jgi:hypothetical protein
MSSSASTRTVFRQLLKQRPNSAMKTKTLLLHDHHRRRDRPLKGRKHASELRHALRIQLLPRTLYEQPEVSVERIDEQATREIALELGGAATQHQPAGPVWLPHSLEQRGLANSRLADELYNGWRSLLLNRTQQLLDRLALTLPADEPHTAPVHVNYLCQEPSLIPPAFRRKT